jgi:molecular chaperone GrpE
MAGHAKRPRGNHKDEQGMSEQGSKRRIEIVDRRERDEQLKQAEAAADGNAPSADATEAQAEVLADMPVESGVAEGEFVEEQGLVEGKEASADVESGPQSVGDPDVADENSMEHWQTRAGENLALAMRKQAELENYRKLVAKDMDNARRFAVERLLTDLFPALDGLAQALATYKDTADGENPLLDGMRRTARALESALSRHGIEKINEAGVPFDGELHQPINVEDSSEVSEDTVAEVYVEGYRLGGTVLKPAMVKVLKPE